MKKRILTALLALTLLLTLLPVTAAAEETGSLSVWSQRVYSNGSEWKATGEILPYVSIVEYHHDYSYSSTQRIWLGTSKDGLRPAVSVRSTNSCVGVEKLTEDDCIYRLTTLDVGMAELEITLEDGTTCLYSTEISLPWCALYNAPVASKETLRSDTLAYDGTEKTVWLIPRYGQTEPTGWTLDCGDQTLTADEDGWYSYGDYQKLIQLKSVKLNGDGERYGIQITLPAGLELPALMDDLYFWIDVNGKENGADVSLYSTSFIIQPGRKLWACFANAATAADGTRTWAPNRNHMFSQMAFNLMGEKGFMPLAFYYRASEDSPYVPVDTAEIVGSGGASLDRQGDFASAEKNVFRLTTTALGDYTLRCTVDGTTYEQPLRVQLPDTGLFTEGRYDGSAFVLSSWYDRKASDTSPLTLWLLRKDGFPTDGKLHISLDGTELTPDADGFYTIGGQENVLHVTRETLADGTCGLKFDFPDGTALNKGLAKVRGRFEAWIELENGGSYGGSFYLVYHDDSRENPEPGKNTGSTDPGADTQTRNVLRVRYQGQDYAIALGGKARGGAQALTGRLVQTFSEEEKNGDTLAPWNLVVTVFENYDSSSRTERPELIAEMVKNLRVRATMETDCASWNAPVAPTEDDPYWNLYFCMHPVEGTGMMSLDLTLADGVEVQNEDKPTLTFRFTTYIDRSVTIDCAEGYNGSGPIDTMEELNALIASLDLTDSENAVNLELMPIAYEGVLDVAPKADPNYRLNIYGTTSGTTVTTIYGGIRVHGNADVIAGLYLQPNPDAEKNLRNSKGETFGILCDGGEVYSVLETRITGFDVGLDCNDNGYLLAQACVFEQCKTGVRIDCDGKTSGNANSRWRYNTFYQCGTAFDLVSLPAYLTPYDLRVSENNFLSNTVDIRIPESAKDNYYFYSNFYGTLSGTLTGASLEGAASRHSVVSNGTGTTPENVLVSPRRMYSNWVQSTPLRRTPLQSASRTERTQSTPAQTEIAVQSVRAAVDRSRLTIEHGLPVRILNSEADSLVITDPDAFRNLEQPATIDVLENYYQIGPVSLGRWEFAAGKNVANDGFHAGLQIRQIDDTITVTVEDAGGLAKLAPTLTIPCPKDWGSASVTGPDGTALESSWSAEDAAVTFPVTVGGSYRIQQTAWNWGSMPGRTDTEFQVQLSCAQYPALTNANVLLAAYDDAGKLIGCRMRTMTADEWSEQIAVLRLTFTGDVLTRAASFRLLALDAADGKPLCHSITWAADDVGRLTSG